MAATRFGSVPTPALGNLLATALTAFVFFASFLGLRAFIFFGAGILALRACSYQNKISRPIIPSAAWASSLSRGACAMNPSLPDSADAARNDIIHVQIRPHRIALGSPRVV